MSNDPDLADLRAAVAKLANEVARLYWMQMPLISDSDRERLIMLRASECTAIAAKFKPQEPQT